MRQFKRTVFMAFIPLALASGAVAQETAGPVMTLTIENGEIRGTGAAAIRKELEDAQFILIGEDHGFAGPPQIAAAVARAAWPYGLRNHVVEVGPLATEWAGDILRRAGVDGLAAALEGRPLALPFLNLREDAELADFFLHRGGRLWGVDQEFIGSPLIHLETLAGLAPGDAAGQKIDALLQAEREAFATGNQGAVYLFTATKSDFDELEMLFAGNSRAQHIVRALRQSASIYQAFGRGENFRSNTDRISLIKSQFLEQYRGARGRAPRALFKMGAIHLARGTTFLNTFDIGSLTEGVAAVNGLGALRLLINPLEGTHTQIRPSPDGVFSTVEYTSEDVAAIVGLAEIAREDIPAEGWAVIPLEPLRLELGQEGLNELSPEVRLWILGYDYLITTRGARPATPLAD